MQNSASTASSNITVNPNNTTFTNTLFDQPIIQESYPNTILKANQPIIHPKKQNPLRSFVFKISKIFSKCNLQNSSSTSVINPTINPNNTTFTTSQQESAQESALNHSPNRNNQSSKKPQLQAHPTDFFSDNSNSKKPQTIYTQTDGIPKLVKHDSIITQQDKKNHIAYYNKPAAEGETFFSMVSYPKSNSKLNSQQPNRQNRYLDSELQQIPTRKLNTVDTCREKFKKCFQSKKSQPPNRETSTINAK